MLVLTRCVRDPQGGAVRLVFNDNIVVKLISNVGEDDVYSVKFWSGVSLMRTMATWRTKEPWIPSSSTLIKARWAVVHASRALNDALRGVIEQN